MSSCFLCDTSFDFGYSSLYNRYDVVYKEGSSEKHYIKYMPIMIGSSGFEIDRQGDIVDCGTDQQHTNDKTQNYVSYRVKKIEFRSSVVNNETGYDDYNVPDYIILFKVPFREPIFDYYFTLLKDFILFSEPESILSYCVCPRDKRNQPVRQQRFPGNYDITITKPFIVGPNDYVGVLYFFGLLKNVHSSARVWFDLV